MLGRDVLAAKSLEQEFRDLYRAHYPAVYAYFRRRTTLESAQDGTAETFLVAWRRRDELPGAEHRLPWLYGVARRVLANQRRSRDRRRRLYRKLTTAAVTSSPGPETVVIRDAGSQAVLDALERLRVDDQEVIRLARWEGLSHAEIASVLGCTPHAVDQRMHRAMRRLARELQDAHHSRDGGVSVKGGPR
jgi:RNA polymerase sigma-70 factor (ECF subfamily)